MNEDNPTTMTIESTPTVEKVSKNPREVSLGKFLRARAVPVFRGYVQLRNGQIMKAEKVVQNG